MNTIDVQEELACARIGRFHLHLAGLLACIMFFDGYDLFSAAYVIPLVRKVWHPSSALIGIMLSSGVVGLSAGSLLQGLLADRIGRRKTMIGALWVLTASSVALATLVHSALAFRLVRLTMGAALGMVTPLAFTCLNEWAPRRHANLFVACIFDVGFSAGGIAAGGAGLMLAPHLGWQSLYAVGAMSIFVAIAAARWLPESAQFLAIKGRRTQMVRLLSAARPEHAQRYHAGHFGPPRVISRAGSLRALLSPAYRRNTIVHWVAGALSLFCIHALTGWLPTLVVNNGGAITSAFAYGMQVMIASVFGGAAMGCLADRLGSRVRAMVAGFLCAAVMVAALGTVFGQPVAPVFVAGAGLMRWSA